MPANPTRKTYSSVLNSPVGRLGLQVNAAETALTALAFLPDDAQPQTPSTDVERLAAEELAAYFSHPQHVFRVPIEPTGSAHQQAVWQAMLAIPCGQVRTYGQIAAQIASAPRAIGGACGRNPLVLLIPCHRIVAANHVGGFNRGTTPEANQIKTWLLRHEQATLPFL